MKCSSRRNCDRRARPGHVAHAPASMKCSSRRNCDGGARLASGLISEASMKCSSRRNCDVGDEVAGCDWAGASMKCSSRRNCDGPLSIARHHAHLRRLRERSVLGLPLSHPTPHPTSQNPRHFNALPLRALPGEPRAPERSHQAISGPSGVIVLVRPT